MYCGVSTVAMKLLADSVSEQVDMVNKYLAIVISSLVLVLSLIYNCATLNHILSLYPSLKAVPCYQSFVIINTFICGGVILMEIDGYTWM